MDAASPHLARLGAEARVTGTAGAAKGRAYCASVLTTAGWSVTEHEFEYSRAPGGWALPAAGLVASLAAIGIYLGRLMPRLEIAAIILLAAAIVALAWVGRSGVLDLPLMRRTGVNLRATRGAREPTVWLVAHVDSKWQPVSMLVRVAGIIVTVLGLVSLLLDAVLRPHVPGLVPAVLLLLTWAGSAAMMLSIIGDRNHGTLDNASGVAAVLHALELLGAESRVGVLITDAEEWGLAGARAWARASAASVALNCDSVDDDGELTLMYTGRAPGRLLALLETAARDVGERVRARRLIPGILTDSVALAAAGWETVTLSRGTARTLWRIHTGRDTLAHMRGTGIATVARVLARTATELG